jgi:hypothetical protein
MTIFSPFVHDKPFVGFTNGFAGGSSVRRFKPFTPASLFAAGEQGVWYDPSDLATMFQDTDGTTPVTAAGQAVARINDKSGRGNHATQSITAARPIYQTAPDRLAIDRVDDRLIVAIPTGGWTGTLVLATPEGTAAYGFNRAAGNYDIGGRGGLYFPGTAIVGQVIRNGAMTQTQQDDAIAWLREKGGGLSYGSVTDFSNFWRTWSDLTAFPLIDTSSGTNFFGAWQGCSSLTSFPLIDTSSGTSFREAWRNCSSLTTFPLIDTSSGTNFQTAWQSCSSLSSFPLIDTSSGTNFFVAWEGCSSLTSFPLIDTSSGTNFLAAWFGCSSLTSFPLIDTCSGTNFREAWRGCSSLTSFPTIDTSNGINFSIAVARLFLTD